MSEHHTERATTSPPPSIVCICGSMRFEEEIREAAREESLNGAIVVLPLCNLKQPHSLWDSQDKVDVVKPILDRLHRAKVDLADEVLVVCPDGYIGDSTRAEIVYAAQHGKPVRYRSQKSLSTEDIDLRDRAFAAVANNYHAGYVDDEVLWQDIDAVLSVVKPELASRDREISTLRAELARALSTPAAPHTEATVIEPVYDLRELM